MNNGAPIARLSFVVANPQSINRKYRRGARAPGRKGLYTDPVVKAFETRVHLAAVAARRSCPKWPADPYRVVAVTLGYQLENTRLDSDAPRKLIRDACEGVLYYRDDVVSDGASPRAIETDGEPRVVVWVELYAVRTSVEAAALSQAVAKRRLASQRRKARKLAVRSSAPETELAPADVLEQLRRQQRKVAS